MNNREPLIQVPKMSEAKPFRCPSCGGIEFRIFTLKQSMKLKCSVCEAHITPQVVFATAARPEPPAAPVHQESAPSDAASPVPPPLG